MIPLFKVHMPETVTEPLKEVLFSGYIGEGEKVSQFEHALYPWFDNNNVLTTNNGTAAIQLALRLSGVGPGTEVISTPMTCTATNQPILALGAKVVWAHIDPWTGNIDPLSVKRNITPKTRAIMCVDWGGYPCDFDELNYLAKKHNVKLIEDACHAFGSEYHKKMTGCHCDFSCFSFQAIKHITTVDGGVLTCRDNDDYRRGKLLRWYGIDRTTKNRALRCEDDIKEYGYKFHMNDVAAVIGLEQLKYVGGIIERTRENARIYEEIPGALKYKIDRVSSYWLYTIRVQNRSEFVGYMANKGIAVSQVHLRNDGHTLFKDSKVDLPGVDEFSSENICIPVSWWIGNPEYIRDTVCEWQMK